MTGRGLLPPIADRFFVLKLTQKYEVSTSDCVGRSSISLEEIPKIRRATVVRRFIREWGLSVTPTFASVIKALKQGTIPQGVVAARRVDAMVLAAKALSPR